MFKKMSVLRIAYHWNHKEDYRRNPKLPFWVAPIALAVYILIFYLVYISFDSLPTPLMEADEVNISSPRNKVHLTLEIKHIRLMV